MVQNIVDIKTKRNKFTRLCIGDSLISLMNEKEYGKITISDISKRAGVSRRTYYNYYVAKEDIINDYISEILTEYITEKYEVIGMEKRMNYEHILFSILFLERYRNFFVTLGKAKLHTILYETVNNFIKKTYSNGYVGSIYDVACFYGGLLNTYFMWTEENDTISAEELAATIDSSLTRER